MSQRSVSEISNEDSRLIEANQLGTPLRLYKLRYGLIRLWSGTIISMIIMGCIALVALLTFTFMNGSLPSLWHGYLGKFGLFLPLLVSVLSIACGLFIFYATVPRDRNERVIVCESGLFQNKNKRVEVCSRAVLFSHG